MKHLYLKESGEVKDASTSLLVGTWHKGDVDGNIHIFLHSEPIEVKHERPATHKSVMAEHNALNHPHVTRTVRYNPRTMRFESHIVV